MPNYTIRIFKSYGSINPENRWVNSYELTTDAALDRTFAEFTINNLVQAEQAIHLTGVHFLSATMSTWQADSATYNPGSFVTVELNARGLRLPPSNDPRQALDKDLVYVVKFEAETGRSGRRFYRGVIHEADIESETRLKTRLSGDSTLLPTGVDFTTFRTEIMQFVGGGVEASELALISVPKNLPNIPPRVRRVTRVTVGGVSVNASNHKYFDRA